MKCACKYRVTLITVTLCVVQSILYFLSMLFFISACVLLYFFSEIQSPGFLFSKSPKGKDKDKDKDKSKDKDKAKEGKASDKDKKDKKNKKKGKGKDAEESENDISSTQTSPKKDGDKETSPAGGRVSPLGGGPPQGSPQLPGYTREYDYDADDNTPTGRKFVPQGHGFTYEERDRQDQLLAAGTGEEISELQRSPTSSKRATGLAFNYAPGEDQKVVETVEKRKLLTDKNAASKDGVTPLVIRTPGLDYVESAARREQAKADSNIPNTGQGYGPHYGTEGNIPSRERRALDMHSGGAIPPHQSQKSTQPGYDQDSYGTGQLEQYPSHNIASYDEGLGGRKFPYGTGNEQFEGSGALPSSAAFIAHESGRYPAQGAEEEKVRNQLGGYFAQGQLGGISSEPLVGDGNKDGTRPANAAAMAGVAVVSGTKSKNLKKHGSGTGGDSSSESDGEEGSSSDDLSEYAEGKGEHVRELQGVAKLKFPRTPKKSGKGKDSSKDLSSPAALTAPKIVKTTTKQMVVKDKEGVTQNIEEKVEDLTPGGTGAITVSTQVNKVMYGKFYAVDSLFSIS